MLQENRNAPVPDEDGHLRAEPAPLPETGPKPSVRTAVALALVVLAAGLVQFFPTLRTAYAYDDLDCLNQAADVLAGKASFWEVALRPHNEHLMPLLRMAFHASAAWFGIDATPFRLAVFGAHLMAAWFLGLLALRYSGRPAAAMAAGLAYVLPCGLSSMMVWLLIAAGGPIGLVGVSGALLALAHRETLGVLRARLLAGAGCLMAVLAGSGIMPLLVGPLLLDEYERRRAGARRWSLGPFAVFCLLVMLATALATAFLYARVYGRSPTPHLLPGIPRAGFLLTIAPYRYVLPGLGLPMGGTRWSNLLLWSSLGLAIAAPVAALLLALWRRGATPLARVAALAAVGPAGAVLLVGSGRWNWWYGDLYEADRYFFPLLLPLALLAGAVAASAADRMQGWTARRRAAILALCAVALGAEVFLHRRALFLRVPFDVFATHERRFDQLSQLTERLEAAASSLPPGSPPLSFPDGNLWFHDVHNGRISARMLLHVIGSEGPRLRLAPEPVSERDARILNSVFEAWGRTIGEPELAPVVVAGRLATRSTKMVDFRANAQEQAVVGGFYPWEGFYRWMGQKGELRLILICRRLVVQLGTVDAAVQGQPLAVRVTAVDEVTGWSTVLGTIRVRQGQPERQTIDAFPFLSHLGTGRRIRLVLESDRTWRPVDLLPGSGDPRQLSVQIFAAGCE